MKLTEMSNRQLTQETTINITSELLEELSEVAERLKTSRSKIIAYCVRRFIKHSSKQYKFFILTSFQPKTRNYKTLHVMINPVEYDLFYDLRKSLKLSFSFIVRIALSRYMSELLDNEVQTNDGAITTSEDEYRLEKYIIKIEEENQWIKHEFVWEEG